MLVAQPIPGDPKHRTCAEKIARVLGEKAADGDIRAAQEMADRAESRPRQAIEIEHTRSREAFERMNSRGAGGVCGLRHLAGMVSEGR